MENIHLVQSVAVVFWLWAILCLIAPRFLFFAHPEKKKRLHGVLFPFFTSILILGVANTLPKQSTENWAISIFFLLLWVTYLLRLRMPPDKVESSPKEKVGFMERWRRVAEEGQKLLDAEKAQKEAVRQAGLQAILDEDDNEDDEEEATPHKVPKSEWFPDWKQTLEYFLQRKASKDEEIVYRELFGGDNECRFNLRMFLARIKNGPVCIYAPVGDYYLPRYKILAETGAMRCGEEIEPEDRLTVLSMPQLRDFAKAVNASPAKSRQALISNIAATGTDAIEATWNSIGIDINDLFYADAEILHISASYLLKNYES